MTHTGSGFCIGQRLLREGHDVIAYYDPGGGSIDSKTFDGLLEKTDDYVTALEKYDFDFIVFDSTGMGRTADSLRKRGYPVFSGGVFNDKLEFDRSYGLKIMQDYGILIPDTYKFKTIDAAMSFVKQNPDRYVVKIMGENASSFTSYTSKAPDDMLDMLEHFKDERLIDVTEGLILQKFIEGFEISTEIWLANGRYIPGFDNYTIEEKKFLVGNLGPTIGSAGSVVWFSPHETILTHNVKKLLPLLEKQKYSGPIDLNTIVGDDDKIYALEFTPRCHDDQTEILTKDGFKFFKDISDDEIVATLNPTNMELEYCKINNKVVKDYDGEMLLINNDLINMKITPDHMLYAITQDNNHYKLMQADELINSLGSNKFWMSSLSVWSGDDQNFYILPSYESFSEKQVSMDSWLFLLGVCTAIGRPHKLHNQDDHFGILIPEIPNNILGKLLIVLADLDLLESMFVLETINRSGKVKCSILLNNIQVASDIINTINLHECCNRHIPNFIKGLASDRVKCFLNGYHLGCDCLTENDHILYFAPTKQIADDLQELILKVCGRSVINKINTGLYRINNNSIKDRIKVCRCKGNSFCDQDLYCIKQYKLKDDLYLTINNISKEYYKGKVYCVNVSPNHIILTRRNGKIVWSGNCGYVAIENIMELWDGSFCELLYAVATGNIDHVEFPPDFSIGVTLSVPPYPMVDLPSGLSGKRRRSVAKQLAKRSSDMVITGFEDFVDSCYWFDVRLDEHDRLVTTTSGLVGAICATGKTIDDAQKLVYSRLDKIRLPEKQYRIDIGERAKKWFTNKYLKFNSEFIDKNNRLSYYNYNDSSLCRYLPQLDYADPLFLDKSNSRYLSELLDQAERSYYRNIVFRKFKLKR